MMDQNEVNARQLNEVLDQIDEILAKGDSTSIRLWHILSGLRGPDQHNDYDIKSRTTTHIRRFAFPKFFEMARLRLFLIDTFYSREFTITEVGSSWHFREHAKNAWEALREIGRAK